MRRGENGVVLSVVLLVCGAIPPHEYVRTVRFKNCEDRGIAGDDEMQLEIALPMIEEEQRAWKPFDLFLHYAAASRLRRATLRPMRESTPQMAKVVGSGTDALADAGVIEKLAFKESNES